MIVKKMSAETFDLLKCFGRESSWKMARIYTHAAFAQSVHYLGQKPNYVFYKRFDYQPSYRKAMGTLEAIGLIRMVWTEADPTFLRVKHPVMELTVDGERYQEACPFVAAQGYEHLVDLVDPSSLDRLKTLFNKVNEEITPFCNQTIRRHLTGRRIAQAHKKVKKIREGKRRHKHDWKGGSSTLADWSRSKCFGTYDKT